MKHLSWPERAAIMEGIEHFLRERLVGQVDPDVIRTSASEILEEFLETGKALNATRNMLEIINENPAVMRQYRAESLAAHFLNSIDGSSSVSTMVDIGCGRGLVTRSLVAKLGLQRQQAFGFDVTRHPLLSDDLFTFRVISSGVFPFNSHAADLVVMNMVLHHAVNPEMVCAEASRIVSAEGQVVLRDHDANVGSVEVLVDTIEAIMDAWRGESRPANLEATNYKTLGAWIDLFEHQGFKVSSVQEAAPGHPYRPFTAVLYPRP